MHLAFARWTCLVAALATLACAPAQLAVLPAGLAAAQGYESPTYRADSMWLCRPDRPDDPCRSADLTATEIRPDATRVVVEHQSAAQPEVDCFYVYPTVDLGWMPRNHTSFEDLAPMRKVALAQAARFSEACAVWAPLYRQVSIGTYVLAGKARRERFLEVAYSDVLDAFLHYLAQHNHGRKIALIGHSQGGEMVARLVRTLFDRDGSLRDRLLVAMPIGAQVDVLKGHPDGGSFRTVPLCERAEQTGCVVAFRTHRDAAQLSSAPYELAPGMVSACVNPAEGGRPLSRAYFPAGDDERRWLEGVEGVTTPFLLYRDLYTAHCVDGPDGYRFLGIAAAPGPGDKRPMPLDLENWRLNTAMGTHVLDLQFTQGDLIDLTKRARPCRPLPPSRKRQARRLARCPERDRGPRVDGFDAGARRREPRAGAARSSSGASRIRWALSICRVVMPAERTAASHRPACCTEVLGRSLSW